MDLQRPHRCQQQKDGNPMYRLRDHAFMVNLLDTDPHIPAADLSVYCQLQAERLRARDHCTYRVLVL